MADRIEQRSDAWHAARAGRITASRFADALAMSAPNKAGISRPLEARIKYARELVFARTSGNTKHEVNSKSLSYGREIEPFAVEAYTLETGNIVEPCEFIVHPAHPYIGASPDGHVAPDGGVEIKSPHDEQVHIDTWLNGMPAEHMPQVQGEMMCTGWKWVDFISYDPRQAERFRLYVQRIPRDDAYIARLMEALIAFEYDVCEMVKALEQRVA